MHRPLFALWVSLLAVLLGSPPLASGPSGAWSGAEMLQIAAAPGSPDAHYALAAAKVHRAPDARSPTDRRAGPSGGALQAHPARPIFTHQQLEAHPRRHTAPAAGQALHFPLFPTGPPSHV